MLTDAGELGYPTVNDVRGAVEEVRYNVRQARWRVLEAHAHFVAVGNGELPPLEVRG